MSTFNISALSSFVDEQRMDIISNLIVPTSFEQLFTIIPNVVGLSLALPTFTSETFLKAASCSWSPSGVTTFDQKILTVAQVEVDKTFCVDELQGTYLAHKYKQMRDASLGEFAPIFMADEVARINRSVEDLVMIGKVSSGHLINGLVTIISGATGRNKVLAVTGVTITSANVLSVIDSMVVAFPDEVRYEAMNAIVSPAVYTAFVIAMKQSYGTLGDYNQSATATGAGIKYPAFPNLTIILNNGLIGDSNKVIITRPADIFLGTDDSVDGSKLYLKADFYEKQVLFHTKFKIGVQITPQEGLITTNF
jgi:hypothetical protein